MTSIGLLTRRLCAAALTISAFVIVASPVAAQSARYDILPSQTDSRVKQFDKPHAVIKPKKAQLNAPLVVFLPGTNGFGANTVSMLEFASSQGYRAIGLTFVAAPSISQVCPRDPDPECHAKFREMRIYGTGDFEKFTNNAADSLVGRLVALLRYLDAQNPKEKWGQYLNGDQPRWDRIVVSGQSQGAGMAAFIAKRHLVNRVVLFSTGWDTQGRPLKPVGWLSDPSATPEERWFGSFHKRENTAALLEETYAALRLPEGHLFRFDRDLPEAFAKRTKSPNPYHVIGMRDVRYEPEWKQMFGKAQPFAAD